MQFCQAEVGMACQVLRELYITCILILADGYSKQTPTLNQRCGWQRNNFGGGGQMSKWLIGMVLAVQTKTIFLLSNDLMQTQANTSKPQQQDFALVFGVSAMHTVSQQFTSFHEVARSQEAFLLVAGQGKENNSRETRVASRQQFYCVIIVPKLFFKCMGSSPTLYFPCVSPVVSHCVFCSFLYKTKSEKEIR